MINEKEINDLQNFANSGLKAITSLESMLNQHVSQLPADEAEKIKKEVAKAKKDLSKVDFTTILKDIKL
jgi:hypothetical protein